MGRLSSIAAASGTAVRGQTRQVSGVRSLDHQQFPRVRDGTVLEMPGSKTTKTPAKEDPMLKLNLVTLLCLAGSSTAAVAEPATSASAADETIVSRPAPPATVGWYVAPTVSFTSINKTYGEMIGLRSALMLNRQFGLGVAGNLIGTRHAYIGDDGVREVGAYGGLYLQYVLAADSVVHAYADTTLGAGGWCQQSTPDDCHQRDFAVLEPTFNVELDLSRHVKLATGVGYRLAIAGEGPGISSRHLSGVVARTSLVLGMF
jgi:hypothetical protein